MKYSNYVNRRTGTELKDYLCVVGLIAVFLLTAHLEAAL